MTALAIGFCAGTALAALAAGIVLGFAIAGLVRTGRCDGCGHPLGCRSVFGECTRTIRVRNYVSGTRRGWKTGPCGCRNHFPPGMDSEEVVSRNGVAAAEVPQIPAQRDGSERERF